MNSTRNIEKYVIILAGGKGERFWPLSRESKPKQLLSLLGKNSFLQQVASHAKHLVTPRRIIVVTTKKQSLAIRKQLPWLPKSNLLLEPIGRDTCPAICLGNAVISSLHPDAVVAVLPADHYIPNTEAFLKVLNNAFELAACLPVIVTIGIKPHSPHTGYGYIRIGQKLENLPPSINVQTTFYQVEQFIEKPDSSRAAEFINSGNYRWNAGIFVWKISTFLDTLWKYKPQLAELTRKWTRAAQEEKLTKTLSQDYQLIEKISIDYAIMEKAENIVCAEGEFEWDDIGSWIALEKYGSRDENGNVVYGLYCYVDSSGNLIYDARTRNQGLIATLGINDTIIVLCNDATLIIPKSESQRLKELVKKISANPKLIKYIK